MGNEMSGANLRKTREVDGTRRRGHHSGLPFGHLEGDPRETRKHKLGLAVLPSPLFATSCASPRTHLVGEVFMHKLSSVSML